MSTKPTRLGEKIKRLRKSQNLTQEKLAELASVDPKTIISIETGARRNPTLKTLSKLANALGVKVKDIFPF
ncbi:MAG TPA: helix-turn-helix transcriptional regulator [Patescibacteria group bacterium]|nr:helix-turn-helix transcriptional regulator [Patescibacteria group bacterium]